MLAAPLLLAFVLGSAFGSGDNFSITAVKTVVADLDQGAGAGGPAAGAILTSALQSEQLSDLLDISATPTAEEARSEVDEERAQVAVIIPAGFSAALLSSNGAAPASAPVAVEIYRDPALTIGPSIVQAVVDSVVQSLDGGRAAASSAAFLGVSSGIVDADELGRLAAEAATAYSEQAARLPP